MKGRGVTDLTDSGGGGGSDGSSRCGDGWKSHILIKTRGRMAEQEITDLYNRFENFNSSAGFSIVYCFTVLPKIATTCP